MDSTTNGKNMGKGIKRSSDIAWQVKAVEETKRNKGVKKTKKTTEHYTDQAVTSGELYFIASLIPTEASTEILFLSSS